MINVARGGRRGHEHTNRTDEPHTQPATGQTGRRPAKWYKINVAVPHGKIVARMKKATTLKQG